MTAPSDRHARLLAQALELVADGTFDIEFRLGESHQAGPRAAPAAIRVGRS